MDQPTNDPAPMPIDVGTVHPAAPPQPIIIQQQGPLLGRFGKLLLAALGFAVLIIFGLIGSYRSYFNTADQPQERYHSLSTTATKKIAIITVDGTIMETEDGFIKRQIDRVKEDTDVVGIVLRIDSPGGTVTASDYLYHHLRELTQERELPVVVSMGSLCASGGYYMAMAVGDEENVIFAEPTTWTGSIGVVIPHYDLSGLLGRINVKDDSVASGPLKLMASPTRPMTEEERKLLQQLVDETFARFKEIVTNGRPKFKDDPKALDAVATGQIFTAQQALDRGLVDKIGFVEAAVERVAELANVSTEDVRCVKYRQPTTFMSELMRGQAGPSHGFAIDPSALVDLATPRAYYLWTWLPSILSNTKN
jgi:protease-4